MSDVVSGSPVFIGVTTCNFMRGEHPFIGTGHKYLHAAFKGANALPVQIPSFGNGFPVEDYLSLVSGVMFTGSPSNIETRHYDPESRLSCEPLDINRDDTTLRLMRAALERGIPVLAICRGLQEMNVALGGTLHSRVHDVDGYQDHRSRDGDPAELQYAPAHPIKLVEGGLLADITGKAELQVNSIHGQGINRLAPGLNVEATAPDNLIEAVSYRAKGGFALAVQWHPEWKFWESPDATAIFNAFGAAVAKYATREPAPGTRISAAKPS